MATDTLEMVLVYGFVVRFKTMMLMGKQLGRIAMTATPQLVRSAEMLRAQRNLVWKYSIMEQVLEMEPIGLIQMEVELLKPIVI